MKKIRQTDEFWFSDDLEPPSLHPWRSIRRRNHRLHPRRSFQQPVSTPRKFPLPLSVHFIAPIAHPLCSELRYTDSSTQTLVPQLLVKRDAGTMTPRLVKATPYYPLRLRGYGIVSSPAPLALDLSVVIPHSTEREDDIIRLSNGTEDHPHYSLQDLRGLPATQQVFIHTLTEMIRPKNPANTIANYLFRSSLLHHLMWAFLSLGPTSPADPG
jgi:hypothetical protein